MSAAAIITRARRQARVTVYVETLTRKLRSLAGAAPDHARAVAGRYARALGLPPPSDALIDFLTSADAAVAKVEDLDALFGDDEAEGIATATCESFRAIGRWSR